MKTLSGQVMNGRFLEFRRYSMASFSPSTPSTSLAELAVARQTVPILFGYISVFCFTLQFPLSLHPSFYLMCTLSLTHTHSCYYIYLYLSVYVFTHTVGTFLKYG